MRPDEIGLLEGFGDLYQPCTLLDHGSGHVRVILEDLGAAEDRRHPKVPQKVVRNLAHRRRISLPPSSPLSLQRIYQRAQRMPLLAANRGAYRRLASTKARG
jgi:hypothetical protein